MQILRIGVQEICIGKRKKKTADGGYLEPKATSFLIRCSDPQKAGT